MQNKLKVSFSIKANVSNVSDNLLLVDGFDCDLIDNVKLLMTKEQYANALAEYDKELLADGGNVSGYCYFIANCNFVQNIINCVDSEDFYVDMCYDENINID
jgi:hypothetical protein